MSKAPQIATKRAASKRKISVDVSPWLEAGETLTGTLTVTADTTDPSLTISGAEVSDSILTINEREVPTGQAITFFAAAGTPHKYTLYLTSDTSGGQELRAEPIGTLIVT